MLDNCVFNLRQTVNATFACDVQLETKLISPPFYFLFKLTNMVNW